MVISGCSDNHSHLYRCNPVLRIFHEFGFQVLSLNRNSFNAYELDSDIIIIYFIRHAYFDDMEQNISQAKQLGITIAVDFDDLVFRQDLHHKIDGIRFITEEQTRNYLYGMEMYKKMLLSADFVTAPTDFLCRQISELNPHVSNIRNFPLPEALDSALPKNNIINSNCIGYFSGSLTHQADFKQCSSQLADFLRDNESYSLKIVGKFDLSEFPEFNDLLSRIHLVGLLDYSDMIREISTCLVNLAPLEIDNEFCESKSELKYFDAALVRVPTIASSTTQFKKCIRHRSNGLLATTGSDWQDCFNFLLDKNKVRDLGIQAFKDTISYYGPISQKREYRHFLDQAVGCWDLRLLQQASRTKDKKISLCVLLPDIFPGSGGHRKVLTFCKQNIDDGGQVNIYFQSGKSRQELQDIVDNYYFANCGNIHPYTGPDDVEMCDVGVATLWSTVFEVINWTKAQKQLYFMQDYEPYFMPMSSDYVKSRLSYQLGLPVVCFGRWNANKLRSEFGIEPSAVIDFPVDRSIYRRINPLPAENQAPYQHPKSILFYARPDQPRRLFNLGCELLADLKQLIPDVHIFTFGVDDLDLPWFVEKNYGKIKDQQVLAQLYNKHDIGIAFSSTNPSLIPFEMLSCGMPVVDIDVHSHHPDFQNCAAFMISSCQSASFCELVKNTITDDNLLGELKASALMWSKSLPTLDDFSDSVLNAFKSLT